MPMEESNSQRFHAVESVRTHNPPASTAAPWVALATFSLVNVIAGILTLIVLARSSSLVTGFATCLVFLGISYCAWFAAGIGLWKKNLVGLSSLAIASSASAALCIAMRILLSSPAATGFSSFAFRVVPNPFELSRLWVSSAQFLTSLSLFYAATSAFLFFRFRRVWITPRPHLLVDVVEVFLPSGQMRGVLLWWLAINSLGVALSVFLTDFGSPAEMHPYGYAAFAVILALLGALQVLATCWVISLMKIRNKVFLIVLGSIVGVLTAYAVMILGMIFLWVYAAIGFWSWGLTGMAFGAVAGHSQWRSLHFSRLGARTDDL